MAKKIIITGAAGYVGSALAKFLINRNLDVDLVDNYDIPSNLKDIEGIEIKHEDIRELEDLSCYDIIFHLASISGLKACEERSDEAYKTNVYGTFNLLRTFKGRFIFASSSAIYGQASQSEISEKVKPNPRSLYGETKWEAEKIVKLHGNYCILRFSNIYGKGYMCKRTVADCFIENALAEKDLIIHGDGKQRRDFVHLKDVIKSYWYAMQSEINDTFNIGGNEALNINEIAKKVCTNYREVFGLTPKVKYVPIDSGIIWKDFIYLSDYAKLILGYEPGYTIDDEIRGRLRANKPRGTI